jgi:hypothetical protein
MASEKVHDPDYFPPPLAEEEPLHLQRDWSDEEEKRAKRKCVAQQITRAM